uniref:Uncharacterized protein n=1 Tax=Ditylenchus dipsaci TaxID=166011 RepID=A0A915CQX4_9BILA
MCANQREAYPEDITDIPMGASEIEEGNGELEKEKHWLLMSKKMIFVIIVFAVDVLFLYCEQRSVQFYLKSISFQKKHSYSLTERFSNTQNVRIAKLLRKLFIALFFGCLTLVAVYTLGMLSENTNDKYIIIECFDVGIAL